MPEANAHEQAMVARVKELEQMLPAKPTNAILDAMARAIHDAWSSHFGGSKSFDEIDKLSQAARIAEARAAYQALRRAVG